MNSYLHNDNLYFVPVIRNRLAFAVLFRKALQELNSERLWNNEDLIAVALPPSTQKELQNAIQLLPKITLLLAKDAGEEVQEVFPITPCDPMIEAVRTASERDLPIKFIDLEISPRNLLQKECLRDPQWADDTLIEAVGIERYLNLIQGYFSQPPVRVEPVDTLRESTITSQIQSLKPLWRRILVVCDAALVRPVMARVKRPSSFVKVAPEEPFQYQLVQQVRLEPLLNYLDDYPKLVERYENVRKTKEAYNFDKRAELLNLVLESASKAHDLHLSTRQHKTFNTLLKNILYFERRLFPQSDVLYNAVSSCYGLAFAERLHCYLTSYFEHIKVEQVQRNSSADKSLFKYNLNIDPKLNKYVGRSCNPVPPAYYVIEPPPEEKPPNDKNENTFFKWLPEERFLHQMYSKLQNIAVSRNKFRKVHEYRGGIEMGIDARQTLRASIKGIPKLYVKSYSNHKSALSITGEPIVWILSEDIHQRANFKAKGIGKDTDSNMSATIKFATDFYIGSINIFEPVVDSNPFRHDKNYKVLTYNDTKTESVLYAKRCGWINFAYNFENKESAKQYYGEKFDLRVPNHGNFKHPRGCVDPDFADLAYEGKSSIEIALLTALKYAKRTIAVVAPAGFSVPPQIAQSRFAKDKSISFFSLGEFSRLEREKLTSHYMYNAGTGENKQAQKNFEVIMRRYWD